MSKRIILLVVCVLVVLWGMVLLEKRTLPLASVGSVAATATRPFGNDRMVTVRAGGTNVFSMWEDFFDFSVFIYPFADTQRFLCVYDDDTAVLAFVADCGPPDTNGSIQRLWPPDSYTRQHLARRATDVVVQSKGLVRLPTYAEVQDAFGSLRTWTSRQFKAASFPDLDLGFYRFYFPREFVLLALDTNRQSCWPTK